MIARSQLQHILILSFIIFSIAVGMLLVNRLVYQFPGLFYFEPNLLQLCALLLLLLMGLPMLYVPIKQTIIWGILKEFTIYIFLVLLILFATTAVQYTPFPPIDKKILNLEHYLHLDLASTVAFTNSNQTLRYILNTPYDSLGYQLVVLPILMMLLRKSELLYEFYFLILMTWLIGSLIYYVFPTTGPATNIDSPFFIVEQHITGLKFWQLHHYIQPVSPLGGLIAMPSFHVIWAILCVNLLRPWRIAFWFLFLVNSILVAGCVMIGWHYFLDVVGSIFTLIVSYSIFAACKLNKIPHIRSYRGFQWQNKFNVLR